MTTTTDIANKVLQAVGIQKVISSLSQDSAEAQTIALIINDLRDDLLRMAPWGCGLKTANATYITSTPGTPENPNAGTSLWMPGQPPPPWTYEYQYPVDCLRACWMIPATQIGFSGGTPITTAVTGGAVSFWQGPPVKFVTQTDGFYTITDAAVVAGGTGYAVDDIITLAGTPAGAAPIGAPAQLVVTAVSGGAITDVIVFPQIINSNPSAGGSYFTRQPNPQPQGSTTGSGTGATFNLTWTSRSSPQRVLLCNQEFAILTYVRRITDPNGMDTLFQRAWINLIAAHVAMSLRDDKQLANSLIGAANASISAARTADGNEGLTVNDVTPDWLRIRGADWATPYSSPYTGFDWGGLFPVYG